MAQTGNIYKPGNAPRLFTVITQLQSDGSLQPIDVSPLFIQITSPDGTVQTAPTIVHDGTGLYHADFVIPLTAGPPKGSNPVTWWYRYWTTSSTPSLNGLDETPFLVAPLATV